jgi:hypothetical protein
MLSPLENEIPAARTDACIQPPDWHLPTTRPARPRGDLGA